MEWISVKDRLPEIDMEQVIINSHVPNAFNGIVDAVACAVYLKGKFYNLEDWQKVTHDEIEEIEFTNISHWMPLPEPPTE